MPAKPTKRDQEREKFAAATGLTPAEWLARHRAGDLRRTETTPQFLAVAERLEAAELAQVEYPEPSGREPIARASAEGTELLAQKRGRGQPTKLTPGVQQKICRLISDGNYRSVAAAAAGISEKLVSVWFTRGAKERKKPDSPFRAFYLAVLAAEAEAELEMVGVIREAAREDPRHAQFWLSRKHPERWSRRDNMHISGADGGPVEVTLARELLARKLDALDPVRLPAHIHEPRPTEPTDAEAARQGAEPDAGAAEGPVPGAP